MNRPSSRYFYGGEQGFFPRLPPLSPRFARCHRRQKQSTGLFFSERLCLSPSLFESLFIIKKQNHPNGWLCFYGGEQGVFPRLPPLSPRFARCHRWQKQSTGLFSSESLWLSPSLFESLFIIKKQNHPNGWLCFLWRRARDFSEAIASLASLCSLPPSAKTVHRTVFFSKAFGFLPPCSNPFS